MVKVTQKNEAGAKPKYQQTRLCFTPLSSSPSTISKKRDNYAEKLEKEILDLKITVDQELNEHEDLCKDCDKSRPRVQCTALKLNTCDPCPYSFCDTCIKRIANEDIECIKNDNAVYVSQNGYVIQHSPSLPSFKWACLVCRGLCKCGYCSKQQLLAPVTATAQAPAPAPAPLSPTPSTNPISSPLSAKPASLPKLKNQGTALFFNMKAIDPPELSLLDMQYSEEEMWIRLQIREFVFRFGEIYGLDDRILTNMQNVQGNWKIKKLGAYLVFHSLHIMSKSTEYDPPNSTISAESIPRKSKEILNSWMQEKRLTKSYLDNQSRNQALLDVLTTEGLTCKRWQDVAELLAMTECQDLPIPTRPKKKKTAADEYDSHEKHDAMDIDDDDDELYRQIEGYRKPVRNTALLTPQVELKLINMLLELLLHHTQTRQSLSIPNHSGATCKEVRDMTLELKKFTKEYNIESTLNKSKRYKLTTRINQLMAVRGKREELKAAQIELDELETLIRDEHMTLETMKIQLYLSSAKSQKRFKPAGVDMLGNVYWIFSDLLDHLSHATDYKNSEPCWAYGIVIIGPGFHHPEKQNVKWWSIQGIKNMNHLLKWVNQQGGQDDPGNLAKNIKQRIDHLSALECVVYGEGFFA
ncbi:hypothetical protein BD408DRAFT_417821 [Parasitella parasitica]|nr:hypothetical protein BD408DRAFT_417821 [Parasitella parasitica]